LSAAGHRARPSEISLAHYGVLFLDELPEFQPQVLDSLRQPLETGEVAIARSYHRVVYPARFQLVAAMNPAAAAMRASPASPATASRMRGACSLPPPRARWSRKLRRCGARTPGGSLRNDGPSRIDIKRRRASQCLDGAEKVASLHLSEALTYQVDTTRQLRAA
jgi:magnesium chelatase subunit ChlI-like protein